MPKKKDDNVLKYCSNCGHEIVVGDVYCENCGHLLKEDVDNKVVESEKKETSYVHEEKVNEVKEEPPVNSSVKVKKSYKPLLCVLAAFILLVLGAGSMLFYLKYNASDENSSTSKIFREVSVVDNGIADAVSKVYDSVVVVENYKSDKLQATGTGFVYKKDKNYGYILTNNHVIDSSDTVYVTFTNGTRKKVSVVGSDVYSDVALLKVSADSIISVASIGKSEDTRLGDTTFAIGAPLDYQVYSWSVTRGIISGKNRLVEVSLSNSNTSDYVMEVLQTDTAINSGNSGGPLCNSNGEVIGITNMKLASSSVEGMGFAIPIEKAVEYAEMFISGKTIQRPYLGISMYDLSSLQNSFYRYSIDTKLTSGVYVYSVDKNSSASKAGLQSGDIITMIDDTEIKSSAYLRYILYQHTVGDKIKVTYYRNDTKHTTTVTLSSSNGKL